MDIRPLQCLNPHYDKGYEKKILTKINSFQIVYETKLGWY